MLFVFDNKLEADRVLLSEPLSFDKHLLVMEKYDKNSCIEELKFDRSTFWVQIHGLLTKFMNVKVVEKICDVLGIVIPTDNPNETEGGNFIPVRVAMDINVLLCCGRLMLLGRDKKVWVSFKYESLPNICYWCRCFDHDDKDCDIWLNSEGTFSGAETIRTKSQGNSFLFFEEECNLGTGVLQV